IANYDAYEDILHWGDAHLSARVCRVPPRYSMRRLTAHGDKPDRSGPVHRLFFVLGRRMLAGQARSRGNRRQDLAPQPQLKNRAEGPRRFPPTGRLGARARRRSMKNRMKSTPFQPLWERLDLDGSLVSSTPRPIIC